MKECINYPGDITGVSPKIQDLFLIAAFQAWDNPG